MCKGIFSQRACPDSPPASLETQRHRGRSSLTGREKSPLKTNLACGAKNITFMFHKLYECNDFVRIALISCTYATKWPMVFYLPLSLGKKKLCISPCLCVSSEAGGESLFFNQRLIVTCLVSQRIDMQYALLLYPIL